MGNARIEWYQNFNAEYKDLASSAKAEYDEAKAQLDF
jgi:hypothetical protein